MKTNRYDLSTGVTLLKRLTGNMRVSSADHLDRQEERLMNAE